MYQTHFGLKQPLFEGGIATDAAVFRSAKHGLVTAYFKLALTSPEAAVMLFGPPGVGKTTLVASALRATSTRLALVWIGTAPANGNDLLELLLTESGLNARRATRVERLQMWRQFLSETAATESRLFVVVEHTEDLSLDVLHALDGLTTADPNGNPGANLVLLGRAGIDEFLAAPALDSLRQRIRVRQGLEAFTFEETTDYLRHAVTRAGGELDRLFAPGTLAAVHRYTGGVARLINNLCETALNLAATKGQNQLSPELVARVATSLLGLGVVAPVRPPAAPPAPAAPAAAQEAAPAASTPAPSIVTGPSTVQATTSPSASSAAPAEGPAPSAGIAAKAMTEAGAATVSANPGPAKQADRLVATSDPAPTRARAATAAPTATKESPRAPVEPANPPPARANRPAVTPANVATPPPTVANEATPEPAKSESPSTPVTRRAGSTPTNAPMTPPASAHDRASAPAKPATAQSPTAAAPAAASRGPTAGGEAAVAPPTAASGPPQPPARPNAVAEPPDQATADAEPPAFDGTVTDVAIEDEVDPPLLTDATIDEPIDPPLLTDAIGSEPTVTDVVDPSAELPEEMANLDAELENSFEALIEAELLAALEAEVGAESDVNEQIEATDAVEAEPVPARPSPQIETAYAQPKRAGSRESAPTPSRKKEQLSSLSAAKSIDDISSSMAETLFGDADIDMLSAALASAGWPAEGEEPTVAPSPSKRPTPPRPPGTVDESFDLFDLGEGPPLELVDDSQADPRAPRKRVSR